VPRVNVETKALADPRFKVLGRLLGSSHFDALGRCIAVWHYCLDKQVHGVSGSMLDAISEQESFGDSLVKAGLAEKTEDEQYRICGLSGRIEWLGAKRETAKAAADARWSKNREHASRMRDASDNASKKSKGKPEDKSMHGASNHASATHSTTDASPMLDLCAPSPSPSPVLEDLPESPDEVDDTPDARDLRTSVDRLLDYQDQMRSSCIPRSQPLKRTRDAIKDVEKILTAGYSESDCRLVLEAYASEARRTKQTKWFNGETNWRIDNFRRTLGQCNGAGGEEADSQSSNTSSSSGSASYEVDWDEIDNLGTREDEYRSRGLPIPWMTDPRRWAMVEDRCGHKLDPCGPGTHDAMGRRLRIA